MGLLSIAPNLADISLRQNRVIPTRVLSLRIQTICRTAAGKSHTVAITEDGELYTWGNGWEGALGQGDLRIKLLPSRVDSLVGINVTHVAAGRSHSAVITGAFAISMTAF